MDGYSLTPKEERIKILQSLMPEVFDEGKIDWEKLKAALGDDINLANERYVLNWAGKSDAFRIMQKPSSATLVSCREESVDFDNTENIFIEGENMEVLKVLQKSYFGKIKMIYIDPPYNTGNDSFIYPDRFSETKEEYLRRIGDKDEDGYMLRDGLFHKNSKENGQYHSNWLNMMMPRLYLAKSLMREDGVIFVSIDDNEVHNLRLLMNEIFGEENFVAQIIWERSFAPISLKKHFSVNHDYIVCFSKNKDITYCNGLIRTNETNSRYSNPDNDPRGVWQSDNTTVGPVIPEKVYEIETPGGKKILPPSGRCWLYTKQRFKEMIDDNRIWFGEDGNNVPRLKRFLSEVKEGITPMTIWKHTEVGHSQNASQSLKRLFDGYDYFDYPKPVELIKRCISLYTEKDSIILDFFAGSGTTAHAVMQLNKEDGGKRKFICVQLPEPCDEKGEAYKAGYKTIAEISKERIRRAGIKIANEIKEEQTATRPDLGCKVFKLSDSNFKQWHEIKASDRKKWVEQMMDFLDPVAENATTDNMVTELLLKSGKELNSKTVHKTGYYVINGNELILMLESATQDVIKTVISERPKKVIALDRLFEDNDQLKTNTALQMRDAGVEFKTI